jgi:hypothetical protein
MVTYQRKGKRVIPLDKEAEESYKIQIYKKMITYEVQVTKNATTWYINGKRHREDGPAIEYSDGGKAWYINDKRHREDGPAIEYSDGSSTGISTVSSLQNQISITVQLSHVTVK